MGYTEPEAVRSISTNFKCSMVSDMFAKKVYQDQDDESSCVYIAGSINLASRLLGSTEWEPGAERFHRISGIPC